MTELEIKELERNLIWTENDSCKEEDRSGYTGSNLGEEVRDIWQIFDLRALEADEETGNLVEEEVAIIEEIVEVLERRQKDKLPAFGNIPKKK